MELPAPPGALDELLSTLELLDELGFWACYGADETYHKDMWALFAAGAARTSRLRLGPEVAGVILKDPTLVAQQIATLDELTGGRAELVFSIGNFALLQQYRVPVEKTKKPIERLREGAFPHAGPGESPWPGGARQSFMVTLRRAESRGSLSQGPTPRHYSGRPVRSSASPSSAFLSGFAKRADRIAVETVRAGST